ncbi:hypothetical protein ACHWQZ_G007670 [Mnemiopsis leidyi]
MEGTGPTSDPVSDCKNGDTVKLELNTDHFLTGLIVNEMMVIGKQVTECWNLGSRWNNADVVTEPALPVEHGTNLILSCPEGYTNKGGNLATCQDGQVVLTNQPPDCRADCSAVKTIWKIVIESSQLPAVDGTEMSYKCPRKHAKQYTDMKAVCEDGNFKISPGAPLPCTKIAKAPTFSNKQKGEGRSSFKWGT